MTQTGTPEPRAASPGSATVDIVEIDEYSVVEEVALVPSPAVGILQKLGVNLLIPFINGICLGFGEIFAHEFGLWWGWRGATVYDPEKKQMSPTTRLRWLFPK